MKFASCCSKLHVPQHEASRGKTVSSSVYVIQTASALQGRHLLICTQENPLCQAVPPVIVQ
jgi:hypothetical protein